MKVKGKSVAKTPNKVRGSRSPSIKKKSTISLDKNLDKLIHDMEKDLISEIKKVVTSSFNSHKKTILNYINSNKDNTKLHVSERKKSSHDISRPSSVIKENKPKNAKTDNKKAINGKKSEVKKVFSKTIENGLPEENNDQKRRSSVIKEKKIRKKNAKKENHTLLMDNDDLFMEPKSRQNKTSKTVEKLNKDGKKRKENELIGRKRQRSKGNHSKMSCLEFDFIDIDGEESLIGKKKQVRRVKNDRKKKKKEE